jgi:hypothetical protein
MIQDYLNEYQIKKIDDRLKLDFKKEIVLQEKLFLEIFVIT